MVVQNGAEQNGSGEERRDGGRAAKTYSVTEVAALRPGTRPRVISDAIYARRLDPARCPVVKGKRRIPEDYLSVVLTFIDSLRADG